MWGWFALIVLAVAAVASLGFAAHEGNGVPFADAGVWKTDFRRHTVPLQEIQEGGPPKDGIPAVDRPQFDSIPQARRWLRDREPVAVEFARRFPRGRVLNRKTGHTRPYGRNPYVGYDDVRSSPLLYDGPRDSRLRPMERVVAVAVGKAAVAYPFEVLRRLRVVNDRVGGHALLVLWAPGMASALDREDIVGSQDVGMAGVFERMVDGRLLTFQFREKRVEDRETGTVWDLFGRAVQGPLRGQQPKPVVHGVYFWFVWAVFRPDTRIYQP